MDRRLKRLQAKLYAYLAPLPAVLKKYPLTDKTTEGNIAHAVYYMRRKNVNEALKYAEALITTEPKNPYFWEIKGQTLFEGGRMKDAVNAYAQTLALKPASDLFKLSYAEAVLATQTSRSEKEKLIPLLEQANRNQTYPAAYLYLGQIYADLGHLAEADYFAAEYNSAIGENNIARRQLNKALKQKLRSDIRLRAEDLKVKLAEENKQKSLF